MHSGNGAQTITLSSNATALLIRNTDEDDLTFTINGLSITLYEGEQLLAPFSSFGSFEITSNTSFEYLAITEGGTVL